MQLSKATVVSKANYNRSVPSVFQYLMLGKSGLKREFYLQGMEAMKSLGMHQTKVTN